jgi:serine/threonine-protein kinase
MHRVEKAAQSDFAVHSVLVRQALDLYPGAEPFPGYSLVQSIGRGGYAEVWESTAPEGSNVALKFMKAEDNLAAAKEVRAIQSMRRLRHANLLPMYQVWTVPGHIVISMELAEGSLHDLLYVYFDEFGTAIAPDVVCRYLGQAARAIDFLNARIHTHDGKRLAFQHGDIKPSNILLVGDTAKLADFGLAVPLQTTRAHRNPVGTIEFAAPELFQGWTTDRTDQFSLAVTYCLLRGGKLPFTDSPEHFRSNPDYVRPVPDLTMLPECERPIIAKALAPTPQDRWLSCLNMIESVAELYGISLDEYVMVR